MIHLNLDPEKRALLGKAFLECKSIQDKFIFWSEQLKMPYYLWPHIPEQEYIEFKIHPENKKDIGEINTLSLNQYKEKGAGASHKVFNLEKFKYNFSKGLEDSTNKKNYIEYEIKKIENLVIDKEKSKDLIDGSKDNFFLFGYKEFYIGNNPPDFQRNLFELDNLIEWHNGYVIAQYHQFLNSILNKPVEKDQFTHIVQMLILEYLSIGKQIENNHKKAEILAPLIRRDIETTRQYLSKLNGEKNIKNLSIIRDYFNKAGFTDQAKLVEGDLDKLNKIKK